MQTCLVLVRDAPRAMRQLGLLKAGAVALLLVNLVVSPLVLPVFSVMVARDLLRDGIPSPRNPLELGEATLTGPVFVMGIAASLWCGYAGVRSRGSTRLLACLPLLVPYNCLISWAAWLSLYDLVTAPYHWHKTPHRPVTDLTTRPLDGARRKSASASRLRFRARKKQIDNRTDHAFDRVG